MTIQSEIQALKCADCARSDSAVSDLQPDSLLPFPADALSGWRDGKPGSAGVTRRKLLRNGVLGFAAVYGATQLSFEDVWESAVAQAAEPMGKSIVVIYLNGGNDGLNCFVPAGAAEFAKYQTLRPTIARTLGPGTATAVGTTVMGGTGGTLAFSNKLVSGVGADQNGDTQGFDTLYGDGSGGAGLRSRDHSRRRLQPAQPLPLRESRLLVRRCALAVADGLAGSLAGCLRLDLQPAAGGLARLEPVEADPFLEGARVRARGPAGRRLHGPGVTGDVNSEVGKLSTVPFGQGNDALGRSRGMWGLTVDVAIG